MELDAPLYRYWRDYPQRDVEYVRWYPPTLHPVAPEEILTAIGSGPAEAAFYVHVPFCKDICPYCPFNKFRMRDDRAELFLDGLCREIGLVADRQRAGGTRIMAGYFGGGTPTALDTAQIVRIIETTLSAFDILANAELSIEANPDTVDLAKLRALRGTGIRRISFGVQSWNDRHLVVLGRTHDAAGARRAIDAARRAGFDEVAIDLLYRVPGQTIGDWRRDIETTVELGIEHVSTYCLFVDPGTRLYNDTLIGKVGAYPDEDDEIAMYQLTQDLLSEAGYHHYTINDLALPGHESEHHAVNWQAPQRSYVGMGPGAFSYLEGANGSYLYCTQHMLRDYLASLDHGRLPVRLGNHLDRAERQARYMVLGLRFLEVLKAPFRELFDEEIDEAFAEPLARLEEWGLIAHDRRAVWMTDRGRHYASNVLKTFYTDSNLNRPQPIGVELLAGRGLSMVSVDTPVGA